MDVVPPAPHPEQLVLSDRMIQCNTMCRALLSLVLPIASAMLAPPLDARTRLARARAPQMCRPGLEMDENSPGATRLRPTPTALCPYDLAALYRRLGRLFTAAPGSLRVEAVEQVF